MLLLIYQICHISLTAPQITSNDLASAVMLSAGLQTDVVRQEEKAAGPWSRGFFFSRREKGTRFWKFLVPSAILRRHF